MAKTKISEFSSTPANNTDIDSINIAEGCAPSGINDAIRELMAQLKDFQTGAQGDSFNGPIGTSTAAAGAFTTLSATGAITSTLATGTAPLVIASTTKVANLNVDLLDGADWASPAALGSTTPAAVSATTLAASGAVTLSGGTANGVAYLNGSKVVTSGSALTFDGTNFATTGRVIVSGSAGTSDVSLGTYSGGAWLNTPSATVGYLAVAGSNAFRWDASNLVSYIGGSEQMRLTSTGLGIGTSSPSAKLNVFAGGVVARFGAFGTTTYDDFQIESYAGSTGIGCRGSSNLYFAMNGTTRMYLTSSGNFGIGTSSPSYPLHIVSTSTTTAAFKNSTAANSQIIVGNTAGDLQIRALASGDSLIFSDTSKYLAFGTNGATERMRLDSSGNLGLGVTPSAWDSTFVGFQLGASTTSNGNASIYSQKNGGFSAGLMTNAYYNGGWKYVASSNPATRYEQNTGASGYFAWYTAPSGTAGNAITFTQAMTLTAAGDLALGTTSASARLHVFQDSSSTSVMAGAYIQNGSFTSNTQSGIGLFVADNFSAKIYTIRSGTSAGNIVFATNGGGGTSESNVAERARIDSSGNLLVGQTSTGSGGLVNSNSAALTLSSNGSCWTMNHSATSAGSLFAQFGYSGTKIGSITVATSSTVAYNTSSDYRLKENIAPMTGALAKVALLKPCTYTWKIDGSNGQGFIAHELAEVCPEAVTGEKDAVNEDGTINPQGIDTSFLVATLTAAIQEQQAIINSLKARLDAANL